MNKKHLTLSTALLVSSSISSSEKPNIILFLVDDMGWQDTSVPFWTEKTELNDIYETPNMERLAAMGMKFTNAYANSISSPTRVSLLTGANVTQHKVSNWTLKKDVAPDLESKVLDFEQWNVNGISPKEDVSNTFYAKCLPQVLKENGYATMMLGKAHFGALGTLAEDPLNIGFDYNIGGHAAGGLGSYLGENNYGGKVAGEAARVWAVPDLEAYHGSDTFITEALTLEARKLMDTVLMQEKPFFLYMSHYAVHVPFNTDKRFYDKYITKGLSHKEAQYAALLEGMDKSLGDLMDYVEEKGIADNTVIIFMSDNGGLTMGRENKNSPLRGGKGSLFEGGIREPMIVYHPNMIEPNSICDTPVIIEDFYTSILDIAGAENVNVPQIIDGESFIPLLKGEAMDKSRSLYFHYPNNWDVRLVDAGYPQSAIVEDGWKFVYDYETQKSHLFNIREDIGELNNRAKDVLMQSKLDYLSKKLSDYLRIQNANMPLVKGTKDRVVYPDGNR